MLHRIGFAGGGYCRGAERGARDAAAEGYACPRIPQRRPPRESRAALTSLAALPTPQSRSPCRSRCTVVAHAAMTQPVWPSICNDRSPRSESRIQNPVDMGWTRPKSRIQNLGLLDIQVVIISK